MGKEIYTENINYSKTGNHSIWGKEDRVVVESVEALPQGGAWLNLMSGDGRYSSLLLRHADEVVAVDIDRGALQKLERLTPLELRKKLTTIEADITQELPFSKSYFEVAFSTGSLHLFKESTLKYILSEINRVLRPRGTTVLEFMANIKRFSLNDNKLITFGTEPLFESKRQIRDVLEQVMPNYRWSFKTAAIKKTFLKASPSYRLTATQILAVGKKQS